ncbi:MAG: glycosyltransferase family 39 protein [Candidatus Aenigmarchaeota archaeon]|nr:glycosyltransferase family 39 protein [Candidatus Aenigmarchaeota archaeon]
MIFKKIIRQASKKRLLLFFLAISFIFNVIGANFGLPALWHPDELTHSVTRMLTTKTLNPGRFIYPSLYYYALFFLNVPYSFYLLITGRTELLTTDQELKETVISNVFLTSRIFTALIGSLSIVMIYLLAKKVSNERAAIISAGFASVTMAMITYSHFATSDIPVTAMSLLSLYLILCLHDKPTTINYILSGAAIGLATGTKYYAALLVILLCVAHLLATRKISITRDLFLAGVFCILAFFASTPFAILDFPSFYRDISVLQRTTMLVDNLYDPLPAFSYIFHLDNGLGTPLLILSFLGTLFCVFVKRDNKKLMLLILWGIIYYGLISYRIHFSYLRYILPVVPILIIASGVFSDFLLSIKNPDIHLPNGYMRTSIKIQSYCSLSQTTGISRICQDIMTAYTILT